MHLLLEGLQQRHGTRQVRLEHPLRTAEKKAIVLGTPALCSPQIPGLLPLPSRPVPGSAGLPVPFRAKEARPGSKFSTPLSLGPINSLAPRKGVGNVHKRYTRKTWHYNSPAPPSLQTLTPFPEPYFRRANVVMTGL